MHGLPERDYAIWLGLDVGKGEHHACALDRDGARRNSPGALIEFPHPGRVSL